MIAPVIYEGRALGYLPGISLGTISDDENATAEAFGMDPTTLTALSAMGATDADIESLLNSETDLPSLIAKYSPPKTVDHVVQPIVSSTGASAITPTATRSGLLPNGSTFIYTASWPGAYGLPGSVIAALQSALVAQGMSVTGFEITGDGTRTSGGPASIQLSIMDSAGHADISDAQAAIDALVESIIGNNLSGSSISITTLPGDENSGGAPTAFLAPTPAPLGFFFGGQA